jgi:hypothetical protein
VEYLGEIRERIGNELTLIFFWESAGLQMEEITLESILGRTNMTNAYQQVVATKEHRASTR